WPRVFERFRALVLGSRFVRVSGKVQSESGVIHIVADTLEDVTPLLATLPERTLPAMSSARTDEARRPDFDSRRRPTPPRDLDRMVGAIPELRAAEAGTLQEMARVLPKGRNFQ